MKRFRFLIIFALFFSFSLPLFAKSTVCLNMIVKDESEFIEECLNSVKPLIDYWVIVDTGSTDGTQEIIKECMKSIPGELHERPWVDFAHNRNEALELAKDKADYFFWIDGDDWVEMDSDFTLPELTKDSYLIKVCCSGSEFYRHHLLTTDLDWRWEGVVHESLSYDQPFTSETLKGINYCFTRAGNRSNSKEKYIKHAEILENGLKKEPNNGRYVFYLAQSYRDAEEPEKALAWYQKRVEMGGWPEEVYLSLLQIAKLRQNLHYDNEKVIESYYRAHRYRPHRLEPIYYLSEIFNQQNQHELAYECLKGVSVIPQPSTVDVLFRESWIEKWGLLFQLSISSFYLGHYHESLAACDKLLTLPDLPDNFRQQTVANRNFPLQKIQEQIAQPDSLERQLSNPEVQEKLSQQITEMFKAEIKQHFTASQLPNES